MRPAWRWGGEQPPKLPLCSLPAAPSPFFPFRSTSPRAAHCRAGFFFSFSPPPLHSSSMLSSLSKSIMKGARSGRFSPSSSSSSSSHHQPVSGFIGTPSTLRAEQSPTELVTRQPLFLQPSANPTCPGCPAQLHVPWVGFTHPRREGDSTRSTGDMEHVPCSHGAGEGPPNPCLQQHEGTEVL